MDEDLKRKKPKLTDRQAKYVAGREAGLSKGKSAIFAGLDPDNDPEKSLTVQQQIQAARDALAKEMGITKNEVLAGLKTAADMAQTMADPMAMVRAWSEIGKMLGHYAPVQHKHEHGLDPKSVEAMRSLDDAALYRLAKGRVVEGEVIDVGHEDVPGVRADQGNQRVLSEPRHVPGVRQGQDEREGEGGGDEGDPTGDEG